MNRYTVRHETAAIGNEFQDAKIESGFDLLSEAVIAAKRSKQGAYVVHEKTGLQLRKCNGRLRW
jgi:hypothetical protein